jgi:heme/copper-type cytochrome/quinol oxidase subunit 3
MSERMLAAGSASEPLFAARELPVGTVGIHASGWWGMWCVIATEGALFAYLLLTDIYLALQSHGSWPPGGPPSLKLALPNTLVLLASSLVVAIGEGGMRAGSRSRAVLGLSGGAVLGAIFVGVQLLEWKAKPFSFGSELYGSVFFTITGFHMAHVVVGVIVLLILALWSALGYFDRVRHGPVSIGSVYWHFVDVVWLFVFATLYLAPYAGPR